MLNRPRWLLDTGARVCVMPFTEVWRRFWTPLIVILALPVYLGTLGGGVASADCFDHTITLPSTPQLGSGFQGEVPVRWCSELNSETGQLELTAADAFTCTGRGPVYVGCRADIHDPSPTSFAVNAEWVFCPEQPGGGCVWVIVDHDVQFNASGSVGSLGLYLRVVPSGPPHT